jgi:hypothetical protein
MVDIGGFCVGRDFYCVFYTVQSGIDSYRRFGGIIASAFFCGLFYCSVSKKKVKLSLCLINEAPPHEDVWGSGDIALPFLPWHYMEANGQLHAPATLPPVLIE